MPIRITGADVTTEDGSEVVARIEWILVGGGTAIRWNGPNGSGQLEEVTDPLTEHFHVRLLAPSIMLSDELVMTDTFEEACEVGEAYLVKRLANADLVAQVKDALA